MCAPELLFTSAFVVVSFEAFFLSARAICVNIVSVLVQHMHICVCVRKKESEKEGRGLMPCCQRTPDDEVVKPQQDGKKKKYNRGNTEMEQKISRKIFLSFNEVLLLATNIFQFLHDKQSLFCFTKRNLVKSCL